MLMETHCYEYYVYLVFFWGRLVLFKLYEVLIDCEQRNFFFLVQLSKHYNIFGFRYRSSRVSVP